MNRKHPANILRFYIESFIFPNLDVYRIPGMGGNYISQFSSVLNPAAAGLVDHHTLVPGEKLSQFDFKSNFVFLS